MAASHAGGLNRTTPEQYLNELEGMVTEVGWEAMCHLLVEQWRLTDSLPLERCRQEQAGVTLGDGYDLLKVVSRLGVVQLPRQVCYLPGAEQHTLPENGGLPVHEGQVTTWGLQDWVCWLLVSRGVFAPRYLAFPKAGNLGNPFVVFFSVFRVLLPLFGEATGDVFL